jgi:hypothetical protein
MKNRKLLLIAAIFLAPMVGMAQALPELIYYKFDTGTTIPNEGSMPVGTNPAPITGTGLSVGSTGLSGTALLGTGTSSTNDFVNTGWATNINGSFTIGFWTADIQGTGTVYIWGDNTASSFRCFTNGAAGAGNWLMRFTGGLPDIRTNNAAVTAPTYSHFVYDGVTGELRSYVNGVLDETVMGTPGFSTTGTLFKVGGYATNTALNGKMDEFRFYNRALTQAEILATINGPIVSGPCTAATVDSAVASQQTVCLGSPVNLSATNISFGSGSSYQWQTSPDNINWTNMPNDTNAGTVINPTATAWYRVIVNCGANSATSFPVRVEVVGGNFSGTYSINQNQPTSGTNFNSFADFFNLLSCGGFSGPVTLNVAPGSGPYNERLVLENLSTTATNTLTINGNGEWLQFNNTVSAERAVVVMDGVKHVTIDSLNIRTLNATTGWGIWFTNQADSNTVRNCRIDISSISNTTASNSAGVVMTNSATSVTSAGNNGNYNLIEGNTIFGGVNGPYSGVIIMGNAGGSVGNTIRNNEIRNFHLWGVRLTNAAHTLVSGNKIHRPDRTTTGIVRAVYITSGSEGSRFEANEIFNLNLSSSSNTSTNYAVDNSGGGTASDPIIFANNIIYRILSSSTYYGIYNSAPFSYYYHNTVVIDDPDPVSATTYGFFTTGAANDNIELMNNIFYMARNTTSTTNYAVRVNTATITNFNSNNNVFFLDNGARCGFRGTNYNTLANWQTGTSHDLMSVEENPDFVNRLAFDYTPSNVNIDNLGVNLGGLIPNDFFGNTRSVAPDPGAIEFAPSLCPRPAGVVVFVGDTSAIIYADRQGANGTFDIEWGPEGFIQGTGTALTLTGDTLHLNNLNPNTCYRVYVRLDCTVDSNGVSIWSQPVDFCTNCVPYNAPYYENFETWGTGPMTAQVKHCYHYTGTNASYHWTIGNGPSPTPNTTGPLGGALGTSQYAFITSGGTANSTTTLTFPDINTNTLNFPELKFYYHILGTHINEFRVEIQNPITQAWDVVLTENAPIQTAQANPYVLGVVNLVPYKSPNTRIRFVGVRGGGTSGQIAIDEVSIEEAPPCAAPFDLDTVNISATSATVGWNQTGNVSEWQLEWGPVGFTSGTPGASSQNVVTNPATITGLVPGNCYDVYVRALCPGVGSGFSVPVGPVTFCLPYEHDIDLESLLQPGFPVTCGDSAMPFIVVLRNNGSLPASNVPLTADLTGGFTGTLSFTYPGLLAPGQRDTVVIGTFNTFAGGQLNVEVNVNYVLDQNPTNDQIVQNNITVLNGLPDVQPVPDICSSVDSIWLRATHVPGVSYSWFADAVGNNLLGVADSQRVSTNQSAYWVSYGIGGDADSLETTFTGTTTLGGGAGHMVDLYIFENMSLEAFTVHFGSAAFADVEVWYRRGTMYGFETNQAAWTLHETVPANALYVPAGNGPTHPKLDLTNAIPANSGDTIAIFLNPTTGNGFRYIGSAASGPYGSIFVSNNDMAITVGNAKSSWTGNTNPRMWNGRVHYNKGVGCSSPLVPVAFNVIPDTAYATFTQVETTPGTFSFDGTGSIGHQYDWDFGDGNNGNGLQVTHTYLTSGAFNVTLTVTDTACQSVDSRQITVNSTISDRMLFLSQSLRVYPNPSNGDFRIDFRLEGIQDVVLRVVSPSGQTVATKTLGRVAGHHQHDLSLGHVARGVYLLQVQTDEGIATTRLTLL